MDEEDVVHIHNGIYSAIKENEIMLFEATWMDQEIVILNEFSERGSQITYDI